MSAVLPGLGATRDCTWARILSVENRMCSSCRESSSSSVSNAVTLSAFPSFSTVYWRNGCVSRNTSSFPPSPFCKYRWMLCVSKLACCWYDYSLAGQTLTRKSLACETSRRRARSGRATYLSGPGERGRSELLEFIQSLVERLIAWNALLLS